MRHFPNSTGPYNLLKFQKNIANLYKKLMINIYDSGLI